jgi:hypothetical protein
MALDSSLFPEAAVKAASRVPAYALVFINLLVVAAVVTQVELGLAIVISVSVVLLSAFVVWVIELRSRRSVGTTSTEQTERLERLRALETPIRCVFDCLVADDDDVYVVYSSTEVKEFVDQRDVTVRPDDLPDAFQYGGPAEKRVTTIPDARGAARIHNLLYLGGKRERLRSVTSWPDDFRPDWWDSSLILIGSGKSNRITTAALADFESPYRFSEDFNAIVDVTSPGSQWPANRDDLRTTDYGLVVKLKVERADSTSVYLVIAGVGPYGTLAGCVFLEKEIVRIYNDFKTSPFAYILRIRRDNVGAFTPTVERQCELLPARR